MHKSDVHFLRNGFYKKISSYDSFILDSNVVIKLRDLFYSPHKMSIDEVNYYIGLLEFFRDKDVVPGVAIHELSWDFEKFKTDETKSIRLLNALNTLFSYEELTFARIKAQHEFISDVQPVKGGKRTFSSLFLNADANIFLLPSFCVMLKYHQVVKIHSDNKTRYIEICNFMKDELKLVGAYELSLITELLFSSNYSKNKIINNMLKIDSKSNNSQKIWNSCWDIFFLRFITAFAANTLSDSPIQKILNPILVTRDNNLFELGSSLDNSNEVVIDDQIYPGISGVFDYSEEAIQLISEMNIVLSQTSQERIEAYQNTTEDERINHWKEIIKELEKQL